MANVTSIERIGKQQLAMYCCLRALKCPSPAGTSDACEEFEVLTMFPKTETECQSRGGALVSYSDRLPHVLVIQNPFARRVKTLR